MGSSPLGCFPRSMLAVSEGGLNRSFGGADNRVFLYQCYGRQQLLFTLSLPRQGLGAQSNHYPIFRQHTLGPQNTDYYRVFAIDHVSSKMVRGDMYNIIQNSTLFPSCTSHFLHPGPHISPIPLLVQQMLSVLFVSILSSVSLFRLVTIFSLPLTCVVASHIYLKTRRLATSLSSRSTSIKRTQHR